jgi:hypothetical protein
LLCKKQIPAPYPINIRDFKEKNSLLVKQAEEFLILLKTPLNIFYINRIGASFFVAQKINPGTLSD